MRNATRLRTTYRPSSEIERDAQLAERNNRRLRDYYLRPTRPRLSTRHWYLFHKRPASRRSQ